MPPLAAALRAVAPNARILAVYGSTEAEPIALLDAADVSAADHAAMRAGAGLLAGRAVRAGSVAVVATATRRGERPVFARRRGRTARARRRTGRRDRRRGTARRAALPRPRRRRDDEDSRGDADLAPHRRPRLSRRERPALARRPRGKRDRRRSRNAGAAARRVRAGVSSRGRAQRGRRRRRPAGARDRAVRRRALDERAVREAIAFAQIDRIVIARVPVDARHNAKVDYEALQRLVRRNARAA